MVGVEALSMNELVQREYIEGEEKSAKFRTLRNTHSPS